MSIVEKLQEMSQTVEQLSVQLEDLKQDIKSPENSERLESMSAALSVIKQDIEIFTPYAH
jgi:hypothetical protein